MTKANNGLTRLLGQYMVKDCSIKHTSSKGQTKRVSNTSSPPVGKNRMCRASKVHTAWSATQYQSRLQGQL